MTNKERKPIESVYGGLALIDGVMIHSERAIAVALRESSGGIKLITWTLTPATGWRYLFSRTPFLRGLFLLWSTIDNGRDLFNLALRANETELKGIQIRQRDLISSLVILFMLVFVLPSLIVVGINWLVPNVVTPLWSAIFEGVLRVGTFVGFIALISPFAEAIGGILSYHGAEHQVIHAREANASLTISNRKTRLHGSGVVKLAHP